MNGLTRVDMEEYFDDVELENLYQWIDRIPLSRPKKNVGKDFSDGGKWNCAYLVSFQFRQGIKFNLSMESCQVNRYGPGANSIWSTANAMLVNTDKNLFIYYHIITKYSCN